MGDSVSSPAEPAATPVKQRRRRGLRYSLIFGLFGMVLLIGLVAATLSALFWTATTPSGTAWLLNTLARAGLGLEVTQPKGSLLGDFSAQQVVVTIAGGTRVVVERPSWRGLRVTYTHYPTTWAAVDIQSLSADRVSVTTEASDKPFTLPTRLSLPIELRIDDLRAGEVVLPGLESQPLRDVRAQLQLGADHGRQHLVDKLSLRLDPLLITGHLHLGAEAPMPLDAQLTAVQSAAGSGAAALPVLPPWAKALRADWQAQLQAHGPLAGFNAQATLHAQGQQLDATALVAPAEHWPLPQLEARTQGLDLSALLEKAPATSLSGTVTITPVPAAASAGKEANKQTNGALTASIKLSNDKPGRWDDHLLPLRSLNVEARGRTDQIHQLELTQFEAQLADSRKSAGTLKGRGHWNAGSFDLQAEVANIQPSALDPRLAAMTLSGPITLSGETSPLSAAGVAQPPSFKALIDLAGKLDAPARAVQLRLDASGTAQRIELHELRAAAGSAQATLSGTAEHTASAWQVKAKSALVNFDPRPWFPALPGLEWQNGAYSLNMRSDLALGLPDSAFSAADKRPWAERLASVRVDSSAEISSSMLAGVPVSGDATLHRDASNEPMQTTVSLDVAGNQIKAQGQIARDARGAADHWTLEAQAPALARLGPLLNMLPAARTSGFLDGLAGTLNADAQVSGRWPEIVTQGKARMTEVRAGALSVAQGDIRWQLGSSGDAPLELQADVTQAAWSGQQIGVSALQLKGSTRAHELTLRSELKAAPPAWVDGLQGIPAHNPATPAQRTLILATARGSLSGGRFDARAAVPSSASSPAAPLAWKGSLQQLEVRSSVAGAAPLLVAKDIGLELEAGAAARAVVSAGRADILGAGLRWNRIEWQTGAGLQAQQLDMQAELEPLAVAPLLRRLQPNFGWGGDLEISGKLVVHQTTDFSADIVLERAHGDLNVTDETGTQPLGLTDLRLGLNAHDGVWSFTQGLAGTQLGVAAGALVVRTSPTRAWPEPAAPIEGVLEAQVANLGTWGAWVPAGWRLDGRLRINATLGGRFNAREYTGEMKGSGIGARNLLQGVNVTDGEVDIALQGETAHINKLTARGGAGTVRMEGSARLGESPRADLQLVADKFQLLGRVDRRIVTSGQAEVVLDRENLKGDGKFTIDEGLIDFTRSNAPSLGDDVVVTGRSATEDAVAAPASNRNTAVNLEVNLGEHLLLRGRGIDTRLRGELKLTTPGGKLALNGSVSTAEGTYAAYGQKLNIDRGVVSFTGAVENPRVDIEATRPDIDVRVGVAITGPLLGLRVRLFSEPEMSNAEKLSWLMLGRASDGLGRQDTALLQRAALALLSGEGDGVADQVTKAIGIDDVSLRQTEGDVRETVVGVGKQLSRRVYIGYEQNLNTSTGSFQVTYRIAQRFVARLQSGLDRSIDLIWTWRWE